MHGRRLHTSRAKQPVPSVYTVARATDPTQPRPHQSSRHASTALRAVEMRVAAEHALISNQRIGAKRKPVPLCPSLASATARAMGAYSGNVVITMSYDPLPLPTSPSA